MRHPRPPPSSDPARPFLRFAEDKSPRRLDKIPDDFSAGTPVMSEDASRSQASPRAQSRRRTLNTRACDRCRRRKAKCDAQSPGQPCSLCHEAEERCTFDLPLARRGPKRRHRGEGPREGDSPATPANGHDTTLHFPEPDDAQPPPFSLVRNEPSPNTTWDPIANLGVDHASSPQTAQSIGSAQHSTIKPTVQLWLNLTRSLAAVNFDIEQIVLRCFDLFFQYLYPLTPLVHEPTLRSGVAYFISQAPSNHGQITGRSDQDAGSPSDRETWPGFNAGGTSSGLGMSGPWQEPSFTLITAVCAEAAFLLPKELFPEGQRVSDIFLRASRNCLQSYLEADLEAPNSNSIAIRYFHSNCIHAAGKPQYSWHIFGEATRLSQVMHLHKESSLEGLPPIEAELRRRVFWIVYMGDKSAAILNNRPITIHRFSFESGITIGYPLGNEEDVVPTVTPNSTAPPPSTGTESLIHGFNANLRLWQAASDLFLAMRILEEMQSGAIGTGSLAQSAMARERQQRLDDLYVQFITCLDDLPPYLQSYAFASTTANGRDHRQSSQFIIQCANLQVSLHCLRMVITQKFDDMSYFGTSLDQADLRRTEIARDLLRVIREAPFWSLQVNGEPYVEKLRLIGASLLAIIHRNPGSLLAARARSDFSILLDILTRLDSKASDALRNDSTLLGYEPEP